MSLSNYDQPPEPIAKIHTLHKAYQPTQFSRCSSNSNTKGRVSLSKKNSAPSESSVTGYFLFNFFTARLHHIGLISVRIVRANDGSRPRRRTQSGSIHR
jgi:hypothetical protein